MRLFVGLTLPVPLRSRLAALCGSLASARWTPPANFHLTLRFIGEVPGDAAEEVDHALSAIRAPSFDLAVSGVGVFNRSSRGGARAATQPGSLWAGIERNDRLQHLHGKVETALQRAGLPAERKRFAPHVTLARVDAVAEPVLAGWLAAHNLVRSESVAITQFTLFSSLLGKEQPVYTAEVDYELE